MTRSQSYIVSIGGGRGGGVGNSKVDVGGGWYKMIIGTICDLVNILCL